MVGIDRPEASLPHYTLEDQPTAAIILASRQWHLLSRVEGAPGDVALGLPRKSSSSLLRIVLQSEILNMLLTQPKSEKSEQSLPSSQSPQRKQTSGTHLHTTQSKGNPSGHLGGRGRRIPLPSSCGPQEGRFILCKP